MCIDEKKKTEITLPKGCIWHASSYLSCGGGGQPAWTSVNRAGQHLPCGCWQNACGGVATAILNKKENADLTIGGQKSGGRWLFDRLLLPLVHTTPLHRPLGKKDDLPINILSTFVERQKQDNFIAVLLLVARRRSILNDSLCSTRPFQAGVI